MVRQARLVAVVGLFLIGCAGLGVVGCASGVRPEAPQEAEQQEHTEAAKGHTRSPEAAASEGVRCKHTPTLLREGGFIDGWFVDSGFYTTNDVPGCPSGGELSGTDVPDNLYGGKGSDEVRGQLAADELQGGAGGDVLYGGRDADVLFGQEGDDVLRGGAGNDSVMHGGKGEDVIYGDDGADFVYADDGQRDELHCGKGWDRYMADRVDYVPSGCEKKSKAIVI